MSIHPLPVADVRATGRAKLVQALRDAADDLESDKHDMANPMMLIYGVMDETGPYLCRRVSTVLMRPSDVVGFLELMKLDFADRWNDP